MKKELKIGIFVVAVIVMSFFVLNYLRGVDIFNREMSISSRFENVEGLVESAPVHIKGYKAGKVNDVAYDPRTGDFLVTCSVSRDFAIPVDSRMTIYSVDIMGGKGIRIDLGTSSENVSDGAALVPAYEPGLIDGLASGVGPLLGKVTSTLDSLEYTVSALNAILSEENGRSLAGMLRNLDATVLNLRSLTALVNGKSAQIDAIVENLLGFSSRLGDISDQVDTTVTGLNRIVYSLESSDLEGVVSSFKSLLENVNDPDGSLGKLMRDDSVYNSVDSLLVDINFIVDKIKDNPRKYLKISVF